MQIVKAWVVKSALISENVTHMELNLTDRCAELVNQSREISSLSVGVCTLCHSPPAHCQCSFW